MRILAWRIPWTEEHDRLQFTGSQRLRHNWSNAAHTQARLVKTNTAFLGFLNSTFYFNTGCQPALQQKSLNNSSKFNSSVQQVAARSTAKEEQTQGTYTPRSPAAGLGSGLGAKWSPDSNLRPFVIYLPLSWSQDSVLIKQGSWTLSSRLLSYADSEGI